MIEPRNGASLARVLGDLEIAVLEHVWEAGEATAKDAHAALGVSRGISLNTVQSTLERLNRKQLLHRIKSGHAYRYLPRVSREQLVADVIAGVLGRLRGDATASVMAFIDSVGDLDDAALDRLEAELRRRRGEPSRP